MHRIKSRDIPEKRYIAAALAVLSPGWLCVYLRVSVWLPGFGLPVYSVRTILSKEKFSLFQSSGQVPAHETSLISFNIFFDLSWLRVLVKTKITVFCHNHKISIYSFDFFFKINSPITLKSYMNFSQKMKPILNWYFQSQV